MFEPVVIEGHDDRSSPMISEGRFFIHPTLSSTSMHAEHAIGRFFHGSFIRACRVMAAVRTKGSSTMKLNEFNGLTGSRGSSPSSIFRSPSKWLLDLSRLFCLLFAPASARCLWLFAFALTAILSLEPTCFAQQGEITPIIKESADRYLPKSEGGHKIEGAAYVFAYPIAVIGFLVVLVIACLCIYFGIWIAVIASILGSIALLCFALHSEIITTWEQLLLAILYLGITNAIVLIPAASLLPDSKGG